MKSYISLSILRAVVGITLLSYPHVLEAMPPKKDKEVEAVRVVRAARQEEFLEIVENYMDIPADAAQRVAHESEFIHYKGKGHSDKKALYLLERDIMLTVIRSPKPRFQSAWQERQAQFTNFFSRVFQMFAHFQRDVYDTQGLSAEEARAVRRASYPLQVHPHLLYLQRDLINPFFAKLATLGIIRTEDPYGIIPVNDGCFLGFQKDRAGSYLPFAGRTDGPYRLHRIHYGLENVMGEQTGFLIGHGGTLLTDKGFYVERMGFSDDLRMQVYNGANSPSPFTLHQRTLRLRERQRDLSDPLATEAEPPVLVPALSRDLTEDMPFAQEERQVSSLSLSLLTVSQGDGVVADDRRTDLSFSEAKAIPLAAKQEEEALPAEALSSKQAFAEEEREDSRDPASLPAAPHLDDVVSHDVEVRVPILEVSRTDEASDAQTSLTSIHSAVPIVDTVAGAPLDNLSSPLPPSESSVSLRSPSPQADASHVEDRSSAAQFVSLSDSPPVSLLNAPSDSSHSTSQEEASRTRVFTGEAALHSIKVIRSMLLEEEGRGEDGLFIPLPTTAQEAAYVELLLLEGEGEGEEFMAHERAHARPPSLFLESTRDSRGESAVLEGVGVTLSIAGPTATEAGPTPTEASAAATEEPAVSRSERLRGSLLEEIITEISPPKARVTTKQRNKGGKDKTKKQLRKKEAVAAPAEADDTAARISALRNDAQRILRSRLAQTRLKYDKLLRLLNGIRSEIGHSAIRHGLGAEASAHVIINGSHNVFHDDRGAFLIARPHGGDFQYPPQVANRLLERWTESFLTTIERRTTADGSPPPASRFEQRHGSA